MVSPFPGEMYYSNTCTTNIGEGTEGCKVFDPTSTTKDVSDHSAASVPPSGCWPRGISMAYHTGEARAWACASSDRYELRTFTVRSMRNGYLYTRGGCLRTREAVSAKRADTV